MASFRDKYAKQGIAPPAIPEQPAIQHGMPFQVSIQAQDHALELPAQAEGLSEKLQDLARHYIGARHKTGVALLESARWLSEARVQAQHGEWQLFLEATGTSADMAERLLNIHTLAMHNPHFAESVARNWLGQSAAALLARPSTPPAAIDAVLAGDAPPDTASVGRVIRKMRRAEVVAGGESAPAANVETIQNPQIADFGPVASGDHAQLLLLDVAKRIHDVAAIAAIIPTTAAAIRALQDIEQAVATLRQVLGQETRNVV